MPLMRRMPHFYPKHMDNFPYVGKLSYSLEFTTDERARLLEKPEAINLVVSQILRAARERTFTVVVYCMMPDHAHLVIDGERDDSDCLAFIKAAKQYSGYHFKRLTSAGSGSGTDTSGSSGMTESERSPSGICSRTQSGRDSSMVPESTSDSARRSTRSKT